MAKASKVRDEEREIETEAASAGEELGSSGNSPSEFLMEKPTKDRSLEIAQRAADMAAQDGPLGGVEEGTEVY